MMGWCRHHPEGGTFGRGWGGLEVGAASASMQPELTCHLFLQLPAVSSSCLCPILPATLEASVSECHPQDPV